jgi:hypothetical protein
VLPRAAFSQENIEKLADELNIGFGSGSRWIHGGEQLMIENNMSINCHINHLQPGLAKHELLLLQEGKCQKHLHKISFGLFLGEPALRFYDVLKREGIMLEHKIRMRDGSVNLAQSGQEGMLKHFEI